MMPGLLPAIAEHEPTPAVVAAQALAELEELKRLTEDWVFAQLMVRFQASKATGNPVAGG